VYDLYDRTRAVFKIFRYLIIFALVQTPVAFIQFLRFGAGDPVGGTYGIGGGSGCLSQLLFLICFYLVVGTRPGRRLQLRIARTMIISHPHPVRTE
jgi:hypothetical protein